MQEYYKHYKGKNVIKQLPEYDKDIKYKNN